MARRTITVTTVVLALLGIALSAEHLLDADHYNPGFYEHPFVTRLHVTLGAVYLALALPQFLPALRARWPAVHRSVGRAAAAAGTVAGGTALVMLALFPFSGPVEAAVAGPFACLFAFALARGVALARGGRYPEHREWMIRALAIGTSIATMRLVFVPALLLLGEATEERARWWSVVSFAIAFVLHAGIAELWIRGTRRGEADSPLAEVASSLTADPGQPLSP